jgi:hypothetical protein
VAGGKLNDEAGELETLRARVVHHDDELIAATEHLQKLLRTFARYIRNTRRHLDSGGMVADLPHVDELPTLRADLTAATTNWEQARHDARAATFRLAIAQGQTPAALAREWGLSRQLVSRILNTPDTTTTPNQKA